MGVDGSTEGARSILEDKAAERATNFPVSTGTDGKPLETSPHPDSISTPATPQEDHRGLLAKLFGLKSKPDTSVQVTPLPQAPIDQAAQNPVADQTEENHNTGQTPDGSEPYRQEGGEFGLKVSSPNVKPADHINDHVPNPEYDASAPLNVEPINDEVAYKNEEHSTSNTNPDPNTQNNSGNNT